MSVRYEHFRDSTVLSRMFAGHLRRTGITLEDPAPGVYLGSSDIGNVSTVVPAVHPFVAVLDAPGASDHTPEFAAAAAGPVGRRTMLAAAEALACTAADLLLVPGLVESAWSELRAAAAAGS